MGYQLRAGMSFCEVSDRLLFLDVVTDRYFCLAAEAELGFRDVMANREVDSTTRERLSGMVRSGTLLETSDHRVPCPFRPDRHASRSLLDTPDQHVPAVSFASALLHIWGARLSLRHGRLHRILHAIALAKSPWPRSGSVDLDRIQSAASAFEMTSRFLRSHDKCLSRSIALARALAARNLPADLIIGVRLRPFAAHCWVQSGPWLVNDRIDNVASYTPILAV